MTMPTSPNWPTPGPRIFRIARTAAPFCSGRAWPAARNAITTCTCPKSTPGTTQLRTASGGSQ